MTEHKCPDCNATFPDDHSPDCSLEWVKPRHDALVERAIEAITARQESRCDCRSCLMAYIDRPAVIDRNLIEKLSNQELEFIIYGLPA